ncbi:MAG: leucine-rich repeat protein [Lachnospiraceae bacterium]|nr:leucine-rich repeat protein [Lachnospiraceae bacterium]
MRDALRKVLAVFAILFLWMTYTLNVKATEVETTVSRAEWIHELVTIFNMKVEDGLMPDDYYGDISDSEYYNDILLAINFGVIDLEAGEDFRPDAPVTREFAAQTLNACLGYEIDEEIEYTMSDYEDLQYPQDVQIAINENWFELVDGVFGPNITITITEKTDMLTYAKGILAASVIEENHENVYEFSEDVIEIQEGTPVELFSDTEVMIYDTSLDLSVDDLIAVYSNGIAYTYQIVSLEEKEEGFLVTGEEVSYEETVTSVDAEGVIEADLSNFIPAEGVTLNVEYEEAASTYGLSRIGDTKRIKDINLKKNIGGGTIACTITNLKVHYKINSKGYQFKTSGTTVTSYTVKGKKDLILTLGYINIAGVGKISVDMIYSADGAATLSYSYNFETGIEKNYGSPIRKITYYSTPTWHFSAKAELKASLKVGFYVNVPSFADGYIYGEAGVKSEPAVEVYGDGKKPTMCMDLPAYVFATVAYNLNVFGVDVAGETIEIYNRNNSPCRICYHIEDGNAVNVCSRPESSSSVGKRGYYSTGAAGSGTYSGNCFVAPSVAEPIFEYELDEDGNATITKYIGSVYCLTIPEELDGYPVVAIGENAFKGNSYLGSVVIPDCIVSVGKNAFNGCICLTNIILPNNNKFTYIDEGVLANTSSLCDVEISDYITEIRAAAFQQSGLVSLHLNENITSIDKKAFYGCNKLLDLVLPKYLEKFGDSCFGDCDALKTVEIPRYISGCSNDLYPNSTSSYGYTSPKGMFSGCDNLKTITFANGITKIGVDLFNNCTGLEEIVLPDTVTEIQSKAFYNCTNLREVKLPDKLTKIGVLSFAGCVSLEKIDIPDSVIVIDCCAFRWCQNISEIDLSNRLKEIGTWAFAGCTSLEELEIPNTVETVIRYYDGMTINKLVSPFEGCSNLQKVILQEGMKNVPSCLFKWCTTGLEEVVLPNSIIKIGENAFNSCRDLKTIDLPDGLAEIEEAAFIACSSLESIEIPNVVSSMSPSVFEECSSLVEVNLPEALENIKSKAFYNCTSLTEVKIPEKVHTINSSAFAGCTGLIKVTIPSSVKIINQYAFSHCEALTDLTLPEGLTTIGENAFEYCKLLKNVTLPDSLQSMGQYCFSNCDDLAEINIGAGLMTIPKYCFAENPALTSVVLPQQVTTISGGVFNNCTGLTDITINRNVTTIDATAFSYPDKLTIHGVTGTYADTFATENGITFASLDTPATAIKLNATELEIGRKETIQMTASITPIDSSDQFTWTSSDETVATIDATGKLTANALGTTTIIAMAGDVIETCEVTVYEPVTSVALSQTSYTGTIGDTLQLTATIRPKNATYLTVKWSSSDAEIAEVTDSGLVTLKKYGTATITVITDNKGKTATCKVTVQPIAVTGVSLNTNAQTLGLGDTYQLTETIAPENATTKDVTWTSSKSAVAIVENGLVTAVGEGTTIIIVKTNDGAKTASCTITVKNVPITGLTLDKTALEMETKTTATLVANVTPSDASVTSIVWSSDNEAVATVVNGKVTAWKAGTATITAASKDGSCSASCVITVTGHEVTGVELSKESITLIEGNCTLLEVIVSPANADDTSVNWSVSNENVVTIDSTTGIVKGVTEGNATITVTTNDGAYEAICEVEVVAVDESEENIPVTEVTIKTNSEEISEENTIEVGKEFTLSASVEPAEATNQNIIWISSNKNIATVSQDGVVTTKGVGKVTVTAVSENGAKTVEITIQVLPVRVTGVVINSDTLELLIGEEAALQANILPENATNKEVLWSSSGRSIVSVDRNGRIKANAIGTATITVATEDGEYKASCKVTVKPILVTSISLDSSQLSLKVGDKKKLRETVLPGNATDKTITWSSSNAKVATVDTNGNVTAVAEGTANIVVVAADGSGVEARCAVTVAKKQEPSTQQPSVDNPLAEDPTTQEPDETKELPKVGSKKTVSSGQYKVTKSSSKSKEVAFLKPKSSKKTSVSIPSTIKINGYTYKVTEISSKAFKNNKKLESVTIGKNVKKIGKEAFYNCKKLKKITIKSTVLQSVGKNAIKNIDKKATIKVPKKQLRKYEKLFKSKTGYKKTMKIKK